MRDAIALVMALLLVANDLGDAHALVLSKDLAGAILRSVVGDNHEIDALGQVILEVGLDHVRLVAHQERHHELHTAGILVVARTVDGHGASAGLPGRVAWLLRAIGLDQSAVGKRRVLIYDESTRRLNNWEAFGGTEG